MDERGASLTPAETRTPQRPPHSQPSLDHDIRLYRVESQVTSPRALRANAENIDDTTIQTPSREPGENQTEAIAPIVTGSAKKGSSCGVSNGDTENTDEGPKTPALRGGACAICLSPLVKHNVYTVQLCRHKFHRGCLAENRRAGNAGCPYCRGALERGLTPVTGTASERKAAAAAARQDEQRQDIRNAAARARMALARRMRQAVEQHGAAREADFGHPSVGHGSHGSSLSLSAI